MAPLSASAGVRGSIGSDASTSVPSCAAAAFAVRSLRYALILFIDLGLYPMLFKLVEKKRR